MSLHSGDAIVEAFVDELERLGGGIEKNALIGKALKYIPWAVGAGVMAAPLAKDYVTGQMMQGAQTHGELDQPQFLRRFAQHLKPPTIPESIIRGGQRQGKRLKSFGRDVGQAVGTAKKMYETQGDYMKKTLTGG